MKEGLTIGQLSEINAELHTEIAALKKQRDALAAENACLEQSIEEIADAFETGTDGALATAVDDAVNLTTPATDGVLKRIQAQGVEMFADHLSGLNIMASETSVREFAAQLRKDASNEQ